MKNGWLKQFVFCTFNEEDHKKNNCVPVCYGLKTDNGYIVEKVGT